MSALDIARHIAEANEARNQANDDRNRVWGELASLAASLGFARGKDEDFGEPDLVEFRAFVQTLLAKHKAAVALADLVSGAECCSGEDAEWTDETRVLVRQWTVARAGGA